jgi:hypothetical protein
MNETPESTDDHHAPLLYEIRVQGHLDLRWSDWFDGLTITPEQDGNTVLSGLVIDQAALYRLLRKVRDLGMTLLSVNLRKENIDEQSE